MKLGLRTVAPREAHPIPVRHPTFDFDGIDARHWFGGDPFMTHLLNALSLTFPEGERFFMDAVRHYAPRLESASLRQEVTRFLAQEGMHSRVHKAFNAWVCARGIDGASIERDVKENLAEARRESSPREQLAMTCALEHFTAILAELLLESEEMTAQMEPEARRLWLWHAVEETEHKAVAFDTYVAIGGTYKMRAITMLITTAYFLTDVARFQRRLLRADPASGGLPTVLRGVFRLWVSPGWVPRLIPAYLDYFRRDFHPWQRQPRNSFARERDALEATVMKGAA